LEIKYFKNLFITFKNKFSFIQIQEIEAWKEEYTTKILTSDHPLIYLFAKANGNLNARDKYLLTPLHYAVARNNLSGIKQLIKLNVDIEVNFKKENFSNYSNNYFNLVKRSSRNTSITFSM
jgi:ankyrin repeat protein